MNRAVFLIGIAVMGGAAFGQATVAPVERTDDAQRPAPAKQRVEPALDVWWQDAVFYHLFVRSFADASVGPLAGDGIGDFRGLIERLDYLNDGDPQTNADLGVNAIWLMPITESPSYHGYDTTDYRLIEPDYGTNDDFRAFIAACEARGIRVIVDLVLNHISSAHPWFTAAVAGDPEKRDWFIWREHDPGFRGPWGQQVWHRLGNEHYYGIFWRGMPDLNYEHPPVTEAIFDVIRFWLDDMQADGFRLDAIRHLIEDGQVQDNTPATHAWLRRFGTHVKSIKPDAVTVGEIWAGSDDVSRYVGDQMDIAFEFDLAYAIVDAIRDRRADRLVGQLRRIEELYPLGMYATFLRNHDQPRVLHELEGDREAAKLAAAIQFALPGVPFVYYGEEIGMSATKPDPDIRTPMQWSAESNAGFSTAAPWKAPKEDHVSVNVAAQRLDMRSMLMWYKRLINARMRSETLRKGSVEIRETGHEGLFALTRTLGADRVLCVFNLSENPIGPTPIDDVVPGAGGFATDLMPGWRSAIQHEIPALAPRGAIFLTIMPDRDDAP